MENLACMNDCSGNGDCIKGHCECRTGWTFTDCSIKQCPNDCAGPDGKVRGKCESGKCICNAGWTGLACASKAGQAFRAMKNHARRTVTATASVSKAFASATGASRGRNAAS